ncbi:hypothetical protein [Cypionkella aquatica]|uniref:hypothetical protein n=1 Tax=Cypionkella aquatica TaxID=1756042 RepID=UPI0024E04FEB|nr:hypothetical protein [Cypionkella aquatica]
MQISGMDEAESQTVKHHLSNRASHYTERAALIDYSQRAAQNQALSVLDLSFRVRVMANRTRESIEIKSLPDLNRRAFVMLRRSSLGSFQLEFLNFIHCNYRTFHVRIFRCGQSDLFWLRGL